MQNILAIYTKEEDINEIVEKIKHLNFDDIEKHSHFEFSISEKLTDINKLKQTFSKFELIKSIELRENEKKQKYYSFNYELEDSTFVVLSLVLNPKPLLINGFHVSRNYKQFEKSLRKNYSSKFI